MEEKGTNKGVSNKRKASLTSEMVLVKARKMQSITRILSLGTDIWIVSAKTKHSCTIVNSTKQY